MLKKCFLVSNPSKCLKYTKAFLENDDEIILPRYIEPKYLESYLLEDFDYIDGLEISKISSFPYKILNKHGGKIFKKLDQIFISEKMYDGSLSKGLLRTVINSILELKKAYFDKEFLTNFLKESPNNKLLLKYYEKYQMILEKYDLKDEADILKDFIDLVSNPNFLSPYFENKNFIFSGFNYLSSYELLIINTLAKRSNVKLIIPNILSINSDYIKFLKEELSGFDFQEIAEKESKPALYNFDSKDEEISYIFDNISNKTSLIPVSDLDLYYSLFKLRTFNVSYSGSVRLDKSTILKILIKILNLTKSSLSYVDLIEILNYDLLWENSNSVKLLLIKIKELRVFPNCYKDWEKISKIDKIKENKEANLEVLKFLNSIVNFPKNINTKKFVDIFLNFLKEINLLSKLEKNIEFNDILNLIYRVVQSIDQEMISLDLLIEKILLHAEENYISNICDYYTDIIILPVNSITSNINEKVWFVGYDDNKIENQENPILRDDMIANLRPFGLLYPTSYEKNEIDRHLILKSLSNANATTSLSYQIPNLTLPPPKILKEKFNYDILKNEDTSVNFINRDLSLTSLETYTKCPYDFFLNHLIGVKNIDENYWGLNNLEEGNILHKFLELYLNRYIKENEFNLEDSILAAIDTKKILIDENYKNIYLIKFKNILHKFLESEKKYVLDYNIKILDFEKSIKSYIKLIKDDIVFLDSEKPDSFILKNTIDRIDLIEGKILITDYKAKKLPSKKEIEMGKKFQVPMYILTVSKLMNNYECIGGVYKSIKSDDKQYIVKNGYNFPNPIYFESITDLEFKNILVNNLKNISGGIYTPKPFDEESCKKCNYRRCCGVRFK